MSVGSIRSVNIKIINRIWLKFTIVILLAIVSGCGSDEDDNGGPTPTPGIFADFTVDKNSIIEQETVLFSDLSVGEPASWAWTFEGGTPATSTEKNPIITYNNKGLFNVTLKASNGQGSSTKTKKNFIEVN